MSRDVKMPSGATLGVNPAPFAEAKQLYQVMAKELQKISVMGGDYNTLLKDLFCIGMSSPAIDAALTICMARCTYDFGKGAMKIDAQSFEAVENRQDYIPACLEVVKENVGPFMKSLSAGFGEAMRFLLGFRSSNATKTTPSSSGSNSSASAMPEDSAKPES